MYTFTGSPVFHAPVIRCSPANSAADPAAYVIVYRAVVVFTQNCNCKVVRFRLMNHCAFASQPTLEHWASMDIHVVVSTGSFIHT